MNNAQCSLHTIYLQQAMGPFTQDNDWLLLLFRGSSFAELFPDGLQYFASNFARRI